MKSAFLFGPRDLRLVETEPSSIGPSEVRIEVACSGICGTDLHRYVGMVIETTPVTGPRPLGHEFSGRVLEVGAEVTQFRTDDRVTAIPNAACGACAMCRNGRAGVCQRRSSIRQGSWSASLVVPMQNLYHLPDQVSDRRGALTEPLGCALRALDRSSLRSGDRVAIIGAGPIGLLILVLARASGASWIGISEPNAYRRGLAMRLGADLAFDPASGSLPEAVFASTDGLGVDIAFEAVGLPATIETALELVAPGGTLVVVGVADASARAAINPQRMFLRELTIRGVRGPTYAVERAIRWMAVLDLDPIITHSFPIESAAEAVEFALEGNAGKVMLEPPDRNSVRR